MAKLAANAARGKSAPYVLEDQVGHLLRRAHQRHAAIFQEMIGDAQLTPLQFAALVKLGDDPGLGKIILKLAEQMQQRKAKKKSGKRKKK